MLLNLQYLRIKASLQLPSEMLNKINAFVLAVSGSFKWQELSVDFRFSPKSQGQNICFTPDCSDYMFEGKHFISLKKFLPFRKVVSDQYLNEDRALVIRVLKLSETF